MFTYQIKEARERLGIKQSELAQEARMDRTVLSYAENGYSLLRSEQLKGLELALSRLMAKRFEDIEAVLKGKLRLISELKNPGHLRT
jgi:ribosome-binding protein aMBF1 (putative translation factor)